MIGVVEDSYVWSKIQNDFLKIHPGKLQFVKNIPIHKIFIVVKLYINEKKREKHKNNNKKVFSV